MLRYEIFSPKQVVNYLLESIEYYPGAYILNKHFMDNSCGNGQIMVEAVNRYIQAYIDIHGNYDGLENDIKTYFHGIDIVEDYCSECRDKIYDIVSKYCDISKDDIDIKCGNTFFMADEYAGKMDFVVGNPPYIRYHSLSDKDRDYIKTLPICRIGLPDVYIAFFEIGMRMLSKYGILSYITPSSWISSNSGSLFRNKLNMSGSLKAIIDFEHYQLFDDNVMTYSMITIIENNDYNEFEYYRFNGKKIEFVDILHYSTAFSNGKLYLGTKDELTKVKKIFDNTDSNGIEVKNGFATLGDNIFMQGFESYMIERYGEIPETKYSIKCLKASTGDVHDCLFPYNRTGKEVEIATIEDLKCDVVYDYIIENKELLEKRDYDKNWYGFGRSQGINDISRVKYAVNTIIKSVGDIKLRECGPDCGVYSGLYILVNNENIKDSLEYIKSRIESEDFLSFVKCLKHYKSGGYYNFTSKELEKFLNFNF